MATVSNTSPLLNLAIIGELEVTGALGILLQAAQEGSLDSLSDALDRLEDEAGFWIAPALRKHILRERGEE